MTEADVAVGTRVRLLTQYFFIPSGTQGVIDRVWAESFDVAWDMVDAPLPKDYHHFNRRLVTQAKLCRNGFITAHVSDYLEKI